MPEHASGAVTISVRLDHIREAGRLAAEQGGRQKIISPVLMALQEQTRFMYSEVTTKGITLVVTFKKERVRFQPNPELRAFVVPWAQGDALEPVEFTLEPAP